MAVEVERGSAVGLGFRVPGDDPSAALPWADHSRQIARRSSLLERSNVVKRFFSMIAGEAEDDDARGRGSDRGWVLERAPAATSTFLVDLESEGAEVIDMAAE